MACVWGRGEEGPGQLEGGMWWRQSEGCAAGERWVAWEQALGLQECFEEGWWGWTPL